MEIFGPQELGRITINKIREAILVLELTPEDTVLLNRRDFDNIVEEYRDTYGHSIPEPYYLLSILIDEDERGTVPSEHIVVLLDDSRPVRQRISAAAVQAEAEDTMTIYRCGWCGNVVGEGGRLLDSDTRLHHINVLSRESFQGQQKDTDGDCCPHGSETPTPRQLSV